MNTRRPAPLPAALAALALAFAAGCTSPPPAATTTADPEIARLSKLAHQLYQQGASDKAAPFYQRALERARAADDNASAGRLATNLAICALENGDPAGARRLLREAEFALRTAHQPLTDVRLLDLRALLAAGEVDAARTAAEKFAADASLPAAARAHALLVQAEAATTREAWDEAWGLATRARRLAGRAAPAAFQTRAALAEGAIATGQRHPELAVKCYLEAAERARDAGLGSLIAPALGHAADLQAESDPQAAAALYYRAARAEFAAGRAAAARKWVEAGLQAAGKANDAALTGLLKDLRAPDAIP